MIVSFSVSNFRSFASEETLSLVASRRIGTVHPTHTAPIPDSDERVLVAAILYGANGAGKSNLFNAIKFLIDLVRGRSDQGLQTTTNREVFRLGAASDEPTSFDLQFIAQHKLYRFGLKMDDRRIAEEWLARVIGGREELVYERTTDENGNVTVDAPAFRDISQKLAALATVGGPKSQSFLATIQKNLNSQEIGDELQAILGWFLVDSTLIGPGESIFPIGHKALNQPRFLEFASDFLRSASTGVYRLEQAREEVSEKELRERLPDQLVLKVLGDLKSGSTRTAIVRIDESTELVAERSADNRFYKITTRATHEHEDGSMVPFDLANESDGTRRLLNILPALYAPKDNNGVYVIDEIDRSMHPILARKFLEFFLKTCQGTSRQVIVTTHESGLLDLDLLRRDEIWFVEKDSRGATRLYSLTDFQPRKDSEIRSHYLQGRFGAIPFLGTLDRLLTEASTDE